MTNKYRFLSAAAFLAACFSVACAISPAAAQADAPQASGQTYPIFVPRYAGLTPKECDQTTDAILGQKAALEDDLLAQLKQNALTPEAKGVLFDLAGEFKVSGAIDVLINNIGFWHIRAFVNGVSTENETATATHMDGGYLAEQSLVEIGNPAFNSLLTVIGSRRADVPFVAAKVTNYCRVLYEVKGSAYAALQVQKLLAGAKDPVIQGQCRAVLKRLKDFPPD